MTSRLRFIALDLLLFFQLILGTSLSTESTPEDVYASSRLALRGAMASFQSSSEAAANIFGSRASIFPQFPNEAASVLERRTFNPDTLGALYCNLGWASAAGYRALQMQLEYLRGHTESWCDCPARTCVRVSCSWGAAVYLCNDREDHIYVTCPDIADYAQWVQDHCINRWRSTINGQIFDRGNWDVIVRGDDC